MSVSSLSWRTWFSVTLSSCAVCLICIIRVFISTHKKKKKKVGLFDKQEDKSKDMNQNKRTLTNSIAFVLQIKALTTATKLC